MSSLETVLKPNWMLLIWMNRFAISLYSAVDECTDLRSKVGCRYSSWSVDSPKQFKILRLQKFSNINLRAKSWSKLCKNLNFDNSRRTVLSTFGTLYESLYSGNQAANYSETIYKDVCGIPHYNSWFHFGILKNISNVHSKQ